MNTNCDLFPSPATSSLLGPNILPSILFSNSSGILPSLNLLHKDLHSYKRTFKITDYFNRYVFRSHWRWQNVLNRVTASISWHQSAPNFPHESNFYLLQPIHYILSLPHFGRIHCCFYCTLRCSPALRCRKVNPYGYFFSVFTSRCTSSLLSSSFCVLDVILVHIFSNFNNQFKSEVGGRIRPMLVLKRIYPTATPGCFKYIRHSGMWAPSSAIFPSSSVSRVHSWWLMYPFLMIAQFSCKVRG